MITRFDILMKYQKIQDFPETLITEGLINSWSYGIVEKHLWKLFEKYNKNIKIYSSHLGFDLIIPKETFNKKLHEEFFNLLKISGYLISYFYFDDRIIKKQIRNLTVSDIYSEYKTLHIHLIKKFDLENIDGIPEELYHVTNSEYLPKNKKYGLVPKIKNKLENHPERIYILNNYDGAEMFLKRLSEDYENSNFIILTINCKLLKSIKLYYDPTFFYDIEDYHNSDIKAYYTYDNISPYEIDFGEKIK